MRIGVIGTGWVTGLHLDAIKRIDNAEVIAFAGRNPGRARELATPFKASVYDNAFQMLKHERLDVVYMLLPPHLHGDIEKACSEHVRGMLIEKPITQSLDTARQISHYFKKAGTIVSVAYMNRYRNSIQRVKSLFQQQGETGLLVNGWWIDQMPPPLWWRTFEQSGGQFVEQCTHLVDMSRYIMGDITEVSAFRMNGHMGHAENYDVDDAMVVNVRFASGAIGNFSTGCFPFAGHGENQSGIGLNFSSRNYHATISDWGMNGIVHSGENQKETILSESDIFEKQSQVFLDAVKNDDSSGILSSYEDAMKTLAVTLAANESARECNGAPVKVEL